ncbi:ComF family protein [Dyella sedimenti]|uniref:ComF family protein n=1 Tax=Dyella sedimenti TaxID=2919947 RepID=UPI001FA9CAB8|nr:ComF family protein [Dyella sedimenti]
MEARNGLRAIAGTWRRFLLPPRCLLCGSPGDEGLDLCRDCAAEWPRNRCCCARCALPLPQPATLCGQCLRRPPPWEAAWVPFRYGWPLDRLESRFKFGSDLAAGRVLAECWLREPPPPGLPQLVVPVPLHRSRLRQRGYNQALELARPLARRWQVPLRHDLLLRARATAAQTELGAIERRRNVRGAFLARAGFSWPAHVALLDDVMTTGATLAEAARILRRAGVRRIDVWALARAPQAGA